MAKIYINEDFLTFSYDKINYYMYIEISYKIKYIS